jgi:hypothetical protein
VFTQTWPFPPPGAAVADGTNVAWVFFVGPTERAVEVVGEVAGAGLAAVVSAAATFGCRRCLAVGHASGDAAPRRPGPFRGRGGRIRDNTYSQKKAALVLSLSER